MPARSFRKRITVESVPTASRWKRIRPCSLTVYSATRSTSHAVTWPETVVPLFSQRRVTAPPSLRSSTSAAASQPRSPSAVVRAGHTASYALGTCTSKRSSQRSAPRLSLVA